MTRAAKESRQLPSGGVLTHREIGKLLGLSRQRVFQLEHRALLKLKHALEGEAKDAGCSIRDLLHPSDEPDCNKKSRQLLGQLSRALSP